MPNWNILLVLNFVILARKYFVRFYFSVLSVLNFILFFEKSELLDKLEHEDYS